jgi:MFS family permease
MRRLLRNPNFCIYFAGRSVSVVGDSFYSVALILAVLQSTHSVTSGAMVLLAGTAPVVLLTLVGGALADRFPRNRVMLASDLVRSASQFALAALLVRSHPPLWALVATQCLYGAGDAFFDPAATGLLPDIVAPEELPDANSMLALSANAALVAGPAIAGVVIAFFSAPLAIALDAVSFLLSAISLYFLTLPKRRFAVARESMLEQLRSGFVEMRGRKWVLVTVGYLVCLAFAFNGPMFVLGPAVALSRLGGPSAWPVMLSAFGLGLIAGSFVAVRLLRTLRPLGWAYVGNFAVVPSLLLLGTSHSRALVVASTGFAGLAVGIFSVTFPTLLQQAIPAQRLSRVASYIWLARVAAMPLALAMVGPLSTRFGFSAVLNVAATAICAATFVSVSFPEIWAIRGRTSANIS